MILIIMLSLIFLFLVVASLGGISPKIDRNDEEERITEGSFKRAARWMLACYTPGFVLYMANAFIPDILSVPSLVVSVLINGGFVLGFVLFYITEKRLRDRRRRDKK